MSQEWYEYYAGTIDAQTQAEIQGRAEERLQMNFDPETAYADQLEVWVEECVGYGDTVSQALRSGFDDLGNDLEWWRNEADQWQEDTNVVVRTIADVLGRADMTTHWDVFMGEQWRNLGTGYLDQ